MDYDLNIEPEDDNDNQYNYAFGIVDELDEDEPSELFF